MEGQLEYAWGLVVAYLAIRLWGAKGILTRSTRSYDKLTDAFDVGLAIRALRRKAFIGMVVTIQNDIGPSRVEHIPEGRGFGIVAMSRT
jgi:hypothetical protein